MELKASLVTLPFLAPFTTSFGTEAERNALILEMEADGIKAYAESVTSIGPYYSYEDNETALHVIKDYLAPELKGLPSPAEFLERTERVRGHNMAKASIEMLLWDYHARAGGVPLSKALGDSKDYADVGISLGIARPEVTLQRVGDALARGYKRIKLKIEKGKEYDIVKSVRDAYPDAHLSADANSCYTLKDKDALKRLDAFNLVYLEQPLEHDDLLDHSKLARELSTPICLDESITSPERARQAFELKAARVINVKPGRVGGLLNSKKIAEITRENGGHVWVGGMLETGIGRAFNVAFASLSLIDYPGDTSPNDKYFARDLVKNPFTMTGGIIKPNLGPGIGVEVDADFFAQSTVNSWKLL
ncbi:MAG: o-succinylbenzoate synthase [Thaumarchaeota archaeon]|nr:o-succinylbenzoate synthase [Nitrososphaerota archaeon]